MNRPLRVGAVEYLNAKPLIHDLPALAAHAELVLDLPSRLADRLAAGDLDVALIPAIEYFRGAGYTVIPDIAIGSRGPVLSVTLFSRVPWAKIRRMALDIGSRTSSALAQILSAGCYGVRPQVVPFPMGDRADDCDADAVLLIGDRAMHACLPGFRFAYDLGAEWHEWTGLPAVFAVWAVRPGVDLGGVEPALHRAKQAGLAAIGEIAVRESRQLGLDAGFCRRYLQTLIRFDLGSNELAGLRRFYELAVELDLAPAGRAIQMYESESTEPRADQCAPSSTRPSPARA